jgi:hypothetical protein
MSDIYLVDLPLAGEASTVWNETSALVTTWVEDRIGLTPTPDADVYNAEGTARVAHQMLQGAAGAVSRWTTLQVLHGWGWRTTLWLIRVAEQVGLRVRLQVEATGDRIVELRQPVGRPGVVAQLLASQRVVVDGFRLGAPLTLGADDVPGLTGLLFDPTRTLPVVVATHPPDGPVDAGDLQGLTDTIGGLAHVVDLPTPVAAQRLGAALGNQHLAVADGGVRLYWPGLRANADPAAHPLLSPDRVRARGYRGTATTLFRRLAQSSVRTPAVPDLEHILRAEETAAARKVTNDRLADLQRQLAERPAAPPAGHTVVEEEFYRSFEEALDTAQQMQIERDEALAEVDRLTAELADWKANLAAITAAGHGGRGVDDLGDAVRIAEQRCTHLVFLDEAHDSAAASSYPRPNKVLADLLALDALAGRWRAGELRSGIKVAFPEQGLTGYRAGVSQTAQTSYRADYTRDYRGETVLLGPHLRSGTGAPSEILRIYWYEDSRERTFVIGHVGAKLRDRSNP